MKKWAIRTVVVCALVAVLSLLLFRWLAAEPSYQGRPLSKWVHDLQNGDVHARQRAAEVFKEMGPEGLPYLAGSLTNPPSPMQKMAHALRPHVPKRLEAPLRRLYDPPNELMEKFATLKALETMGTNSAEAVAAVEKIFRQPNVGLSSAAAQVLGQMGSNAVPVLIAALDDGDYNIRAGACHALATLRTNAAPAVPRLARFARDEQGPIVSAAFYALSRAGAAAVPALTGMLSNTNSSIRSQALYALGAIGVDARTSVPAIHVALSDPVAEVRGRAVGTLSLLDGESAESHKVFGQALHDPDPTVRDAGVSAMIHRPRVARNNMSRLIELLQDSSPSVRASAAHAIGQSAKWGEPALGALEILASDTNDMVQARAKWAIELITRSIEPERSDDPQKQY